MRWLALMLLPLLAGCRSTAPVDAPPPTTWEAESPLAALPAPPPGLGAEAAWARLGVTPEKVRLGRWLFFDGRLSKDGTIACASCHRPAHAFSEPAAHATGVGGQEGVRKSPPLVNVAFSVFERYFWDGRAASLAEQAKGPIANPAEMANTHDGAVAALSAVAGYRRAFREVYGDERIDIDRVTDAIAAYEATRLSGGSAYDRFAAGDAAALSDEAREGLGLFFGRGRCNACHLGPTFTDASFHNVGIGYDASLRPPASGFRDAGRYAVTHEPEDIGAFKTPTLRDLSRRAPYMHDGSVPTLARAVMTYVERRRNPWLDPAVAEIDLAPSDVEPLVAFLRSLDGTGYEDEAPRTFPQ
jgi:cytochrome c peroxidase